MHNERYRQANPCLHKLRICCDLQYSEVPLKEKIWKHFHNIGGVVNTGRPLQVKYWGVATPAAPAALTPMDEEGGVTYSESQWTIPGGPSKTSPTFVP